VRAQRSRERRRVDVGPLGGGARGGQDRGGGGGPLGQGQGRPAQAGLHDGARVPAVPNGPAEARPGPGRGSGAMTAALMDARPVWQVRLRYRTSDSLHPRERLATARWLDDALPSTGALTPVTSLPLASGWNVTLHVHATTGPDAVAAAEILVEEVVGDAQRVLGDLVETKVTPARRGGP